MTPIVPPRVARGIALLALANFGLLFWMGMVEPWQAGRALAALAVTAAAFLVPRAALGLVVLAALLAGGVPVSDLWHWGALAHSVSGGVDAAFGARIPYQGADPDVRLVIFLGGALLAALAGVLARRYREPALVALVLLFAIPAIATRTGLAAGAGMALLVILYLSAEHLTQRELQRSGLLAGGACMLALAVAPALDTDRPWFDYEAFTELAAGAHSTTFAWNHDYARLPWSRDGREMLRIQSPRRAYWKTDVLDLFDGRRWVADPERGAPPPPSEETAGVSAGNQRRWTFPIAVSVRDLRTRLLPLAGATVGVTLPGRRVSMTAPSVWSAGRTMHRGDAYRARVYVPEPSRAELEAAGIRSPPALAGDLAFRAQPVGEGDAYALITRRFKGTPEIVTGAILSGRRDLQRSRLRRTYVLSQRLLTGAKTPFDYVQAVQRYLGRGFRYDETPPRAARTLDGFLFDAKAGFCQQFSGAMALLLRMGGVPARVATGFAPGSLDRRSHRYVVRDLDAHSWVEAWFAGIGWVVFDPTPSAAPPRSQADGSAVTAGNGDSHDLGTSQQGTPTLPGDGFPWSTALLVLIGAVALAAAARLWRLRDRAPAASELERALRAAGEPCAPGMTLAALESRLPGAGSYLSALRAQRYASGPAPTPADRRDLRRSLTRGRGLRTRARTWLALRPRR